MQALDAATFQFSAAPLTSLSSVACVVVSYLSTLYGLQRVMAQVKEPVRLPTLFITHNFLLSLASLALFAAMAPIIAGNLAKNGLFHSICAREMAYNPGLNMLYYLNYLMKLWELGDTIFLVLRKKKLEFLHVYHHTCTFLLTWTQLRGHTSVQWVPILLNLAIHVLMYHYYTLAAAWPNHKVWWKKHLTTLQICQFVVDLGFIYYCMGWVVFGEEGTCQGDVGAGWVSGLSCCGDDRRGDLPCRAPRPRLAVALVEGFFSLLCCASNADHPLHSLEFFSKTYFGSKSRAIVKDTSKQDVKSSLKMD